MKQDPQKLHRYIRAQLKVKPRVGPLEKKSGEMTTTDKETAEELNNFFRSVFVAEEEGDIPSPCFSAVCEGASVMQDLCIDIQDVKSELKRLQMNKAAGPDGIPSVILKRCADVLARPLTIFFQKSRLWGYTY